MKGTENNTQVDVSELAHQWTSVNVSMKTFLNTLGQLQQLHSNGALTSSNHESDIIVPPESNIVQLNVGGQIFHTTTETLTGGGETTSFFSALLDNKDISQSPKNGGEYFIDRSPLLFPYVLDYLRTPTSTLVLEDIPEQQRRQVEEEFEFYSMPTSRIVRQRLQWRSEDVDRCSDVVGFDPRTRTVWKKADREPSKPAILLLCNPLHTTSESDIIHWNFVSRGNVSHWYFGICSRDGYSNKWLTVELSSGHLFDRCVDPEKGVFKAANVNERCVVDLVYYRREAVCVISVGGKTVRRGLHPDTAAEPYPCVLMNRKSSNTGSVQVQWVA